MAANIQDKEDILELAVSKYMSLGAPRMGVGGSPPPPAPYPQHSYSILKRQFSGSMPASRDSQLK